MPRGDSGDGPDSSSCWARVASAFWAFLARRFALLARGFSLDLFSIGRRIRGYLVKALGAAQDEIAYGSEDGA
jgi:hypothetical protein